MGDAAVESWLAARAPERGARGRLKPGTVIGEWRVVVFLGAGLSAEVYRVQNVRFGHEGALKLLVNEARGLKERFLAEADALRFLSLPALPNFFGAGKVDGKPYYVMEHLQPLPDPMPRAEIPRFMNKVAKAVHRLHEAGYVHRDLKPGNILRRGNGDPVLIDLGLIKRRGNGADPIGRHARGISVVDGKPIGVGTLDFAAPEQLLKGEASVQSDIFALGKILRFLYEGHPPQTVKPIIRRATRELPGDRYPSADAFAAAIRHRHRPLILCIFLSLLAVAAVAYAVKNRPLTGKDPTVPPEPKVKQSLAEDPAAAHARRPDEEDGDYLQRMLPLAEAGDALAQAAVAEAYFYGRSTETNRVTAVSWYRKAAAAGNADAQASLGLCLFRGWGCNKDFEEAVSWYTKAATQGNLGAMNDLAFCYLHGYGVEEDREMGFQLAMEAAEKGHAPAQTLVGECYLDGLGVDQDIELGEKWLYRAARQNNARAQMLLRYR